MPTLSRVVLAAAAAATMLSAAPAAMAAETPGGGTSVTLARTANVQPNGVAAVITAKVTCPAGAYGYVYLELTQNHGGHLISGGASTSVACSGDTESIPLAATPYEPDQGGAGLPFGAGSAFVSVGLEVCSEFDCAFVDGTQTLRMRAKATNQPHYEHPDLTLDLPARGTLEADGAGAVVRIAYTCASGVNGYFGATLAQLGDSGLVTSSGDSLELACSAANRAGVLAFHARSQAWEKGPAFLLVAGDVCGGSECWTPSVMRNLRLS